MSLLDSLFNRTKKNAEDSARKYRWLVRSVADRRDSKINPDEAAEILDAAGKSAADLKRDAETMLHRRELRRRLEQETKEKARVADLEKQRERLQAEYDKFYREYQERFQAIHDEHLSLTERLLRYDNVREELAKSCSDDELLARERAINAERTTVYAESRRILDGVTRGIFNETREAEMAQLKRELDNGRNPDVAGTKAKLHHKQETFKRESAALDACDARLKALTAELEEIAAAKLEG